MTAVFVAIFRFMDARPLVAGILLGALTVKPQLGLLFPLMLILTGRWMVFAAAAATALALAGMTALLFGTEVWEDYLAVEIPLQNRDRGPDPRHHGNDADCLHERAHRRPVRRFGLRAPGYLRSGCGSRQSS